MSENSDDPAEPEEETAQPKEAKGEPKGHETEARRGLFSRSKQLLEKGKQIAGTREGAMTLVAFATFLITWLAPGLPGLSKALTQPPAQQPTAPVTLPPISVAPTFFIVMPGGLPAALPSGVPALPFVMQPTPPMQPYQGTASSTSIVPPPFHVTYLRRAIRPGDKASATLKEVADILKLRPDLKAEFVGSADKCGGVALNQDLGMTRADEAARFVSTFGVDRARMSTRSIGAQMDGLDADNRNVTIYFYEGGTPNAASLQATAR